MTDLTLNGHSSAQTAQCNIVTTAPVSPSISGKKSCRGFRFLSLCMIIAMTINMTAVESYVHPHIHSICRHRVQEERINMYTSVLEMATGTLDAPRSGEMEMSDFQRRMRRLVTEKDDQKRARRSFKRNIKKRGPPNFQIIDTLEDYKKVVGGNKDKLIVVRFYAPWCKACKAIAPSYHRLALTFPHVSFIDVPATPSNANLHQGLGVPSLPYGHIYHPSGGLVEELKMSRKYFTNFAETLQTYIDGQCEIEEIPFE